MTDPANQTVVEEPRKLSLARKALVAALVVLTALLVAGGIAAIPLLWLRRLATAMQEQDRRIVEGSSRAITTFFKATTAGDIAAASSCLTPHGRNRIDLASRIQKNPASFSVARVSDFVALEIYHHHPFVIGAKLELTNGSVKYGRFRTDVTGGGWHKVSKGQTEFEAYTWGINALEVSDAMPDKPRQDGRGD